MIELETYSVLWARSVRCILAAAVLAVSAAAFSQPFRSAADAPASWGTFAARLKSACELTLRADDEIARRLQTSLDKLRAASPPDEPPMHVAVSLWIAADGTINRVSFPPLADQRATADLKSLLLRASPGAPPADMLQPVRLSLSLGS